MKKNILKLVGIIFILGIILTTTAIVYLYHEPKIAVLSYHNVHLRKTYGVFQ